MLKDLQKTKNQSLAINLPAISVGSAALAGAVSDAWLEDFTKPCAIRLENSSVWSTRCFRWRSRIFFFRISISSFCLSCATFLNSDHHTETKPPMLLAVLRSRCSSSRSIRRNRSAFFSCHRLAAYAIWGRKNTLDFILNMNYSTKTTENKKKRPHLFSHGHFCLLFLGDQRSYPCDFLCEIPHTTAKGLGDCTFRQPRILPFSLLTKIIHPGKNSTLLRKKQVSDKNQPINRSTKRCTDQFLVTLSLTHPPPHFENFDFKIFLSTSRVQWK